MSTVGIDTAYYPPANRVLHTFGHNAMFGQYTVRARLTSASSVGVANRAYFQALYLPEPGVLKQFFLFVWTASGNVDLGLYDSKFQRILSTGSTVMEGDAPVMAVTVADTPLRPGNYILAWAANNDIADHRRMTNSFAIIDQVTQCWHEDSAFPLPATLTPGTPQTFARSAGIILGRNIL